MVRFGTENALSQKGTGARRENTSSSASALRPRFSRLVASPLVRPTPVTLKKIRDNLQSTVASLCLLLFLE